MNVRPSSIADLQPPVLIQPREGPLHHLLNEASQWLPQLKKKDLWRPLVVGALALQMAACKPTVGDENLNPPPVAVTETSQSPLPTLEPTLTPTLAPTPTNTPIPTLSPELVADIEGIPDPTISNPELLNLYRSDAPIPQFVNAMEMGGIVVNPQEVIDNLQFQLLTGVDGKQYVIGTYHLDPNPNQSGETLEGEIPLVIGLKRENGEWEWRNEKLVPFRFFADMTGLKISNLESHYDRSLKDEVLKFFNAWLITWYLKWDLVQPRQNAATYQNGEKYVNIAMRHNIEPLGGPIIYQYELPGWLVNGNLSDEELELSIRNRVRGVMERFKGQINYWIVVNEYHPTPYETNYLYSRLGERYVEIAFEEARKANPDAVLIYNDNAIESPNWHWYRQTYNTVRKLKEKSLVDAVGMQMHLNQPNWTGVPSKQEFVKAIKQFRQLGLDVYITEMDVSLTERQGRDRFLYQAEVYSQIIGTYLKETQGQKAQIINFFGLRDSESWIEEDLNYPNADPLLFDDYGRPKPAYYAILQILYSSSQQK